MRRSVSSSVFWFLAGALAWGAAPAQAATCRDMDANTQCAVHAATRHMVEAVTRHLVASAIADTVAKEDSTKHPNVHIRIGDGDHELVNVEVEDDDNVRQA